MANPKRRHSRSRRDKRRANWKINSANFFECPQCHENVLPHRICPHCGYYKNETVLIVKEKKKKKET